MGHGSRPLRVLIDEVLRDTPEVREAIAKGHDITFASLAEYDVILGPTCWRMTRQLLKYWDVMLKAVRKARYG